MYVTTLSTFLTNSINFKNKGLLLFFGGFFVDLLDQWQLSHHEEVK